MQEEPSKGRVLRCPCGERIQASHDEALHDMLREHIELEHPYTEAPPEERVRAMVTSAVYSFEYMPAGSSDNLQEEGFGPEPY